MTNESHKYSAWASLDGLIVLFPTRSRLWSRMRIRVLDECRGTFPLLCCAISLLAGEGLFFEIRAGWLTSSLQIYAV